MLGVAGVCLFWLARLKLRWQLWLDPRAALKALNHFVNNAINGTIKNI
jgi:hypothetical protein